MSVPAMCRRFLRRADGSVERLTHAGGLPLGMMEDTVYKPTTVAFDSGDALLVVTDGFTEAADLGGAAVRRGPDRAVSGGERSEEPGLA